MRTYEGFTNFSLESNIALLGSDIEKSVRNAAAGKENAWTNAGKSVGLQVWRIEKFQVVAWPKEQYGIVDDSLTLCH